MFGGNNYLMKIKNKEPKILIVSNNSFSSTKNNGKTLASFFKSFETQNIAQLYFNSEYPSEYNYNNYFRITDFEMLKAYFFKSATGSMIKNEEVPVSSKEMGSKINRNAIIKNSNFFRIIRELIWASNKWKTDDLYNWIESFDPDIVFLCAGDSGFAYKISNYIKKEFNTKLVVYITDDYILPRKTWNPIWWLRRNYIFNNMKLTINSSDLFITISNKMRDLYKELFGKDSMVFVNMTESLKTSFIEGEFDDEINDCINFVYAGGLHFNRHKTLIMLAESIKKYNDDYNNQNKKKLFLKIYSNNMPENNVLEKLNIEGASKYCGTLDSVQLRIVMNNCDVPVHVESFDYKSIESTRLSISTKISEYLSLEKPILAIGPSDIASIEYLHDCAYCITNSNIIYSSLIEFVENINKEELIYLSKIKYITNHNNDINKRLIYDSFVKLI